METLHDHCHQPWLSKNISKRIMNRATHDSIVDEIGQLLQDTYPEVFAVDGQGDGGVDLIAQRRGLTVLIQIKHWRRPMGPFEAHDAVDKILHHYDPPGPFAIWIVSAHGFTKPESFFSWPCPVRLWPTQELLQALRPREIPGRPPRDRHRRWRAMQDAGRRHA